jgi:hypothetical protein
MITTRCSALPIVSACPAAAFADEIRTNPQTPEAALGTAVHAVLAAAITAGSMSADRVEETLGPAADLEEIARLAWAGWRAWEQIRQWFPEPRCEVYLSGDLAGLSLTGHADVFAVADGELRILDWKSGFADANYTDQLRGYAWLALQERRWEVPRARVWTVRLRDGVADVEVFERDELTAWVNRLAVALTDRCAATTYNPGECCRYCPRRLSCPGRRYLLRAIAAEVDHYQDSWQIDGEVSGDALASVLDRCRMLESVTAAIREQVGVEVDSRGGVIPLSDGRELARIHQEQHPIRPCPESETILREVLTPEQWYECLTLGKGKIESAIGANAPPRGKGKAIRATMDRLAEAGAVDTKHVPKLVIRKGITDAATAITHSAGVNDHAG